MHPKTDRRRAGFTIVELLVVIAIIGLLVGILLPALSGVNKRGRKMTEVNSLRQIGLGWTMYGNSNDGAALPGYLTQPALQEWRATYRFVDKSTVPDSFTGPWTWRLMQYLDYNHGLIHAHLDEEELGLKPTMTNIGTDTDLFCETHEMARFPAFSYNALYVGGWWQPFSTLEGEIMQPRYSITTGAPTQRKATRLVSRTIAGIRRSSEVIVFTTATRYDDPPAGQEVLYPCDRPEPGLGSRLVKKVLDDEPGCHYAVPSNVAGELMWESGGEFGMHAVFVHEPVEPTVIGRYTGQVPVVHADGSTATDLPSALMDQRRWIDVAETGDFTHDP